MLYTRYLTLYVNPARFSLLNRLLATLRADVDAIIASASPGDFGDRITVAMNIEITPDAALTTAAAAVRDAGAKVSSLLPHNRHCSLLLDIRQIDHDLGHVDRVFHESPHSKGCRRF